MKTPSHNQTERTPDAAYGSIIRNSPAPPSRKVRAALILLHNKDLKDLPEMTGRSLSFIKGVLAGKDQSMPLKQLLAQLCGCRVEDIFSMEPGN